MLDLEPIKARLAAVPAPPWPKERQKQADRPWLAPTEAYELDGHTCDWGGCSEIAMTGRYANGRDNSDGWFPVCERHAAVDISLARVYTPNSSEQFERG